MIRIFAISADNVAAAIIVILTIGTAAAMLIAELFGKKNEVFHRLAFPFGSDEASIIIRD